MRSQIRPFALTLAMVTMVSSAARAEPQCKPVEGHFEAHLVFAGCSSLVGICTAGRVWGGTQGTYQFTMTSLSPNAEAAEVPSIFFFTGRSLISLKDGGDVFGIDTGAIDLSPETGGFASLITVHGG